MRKSRLAAVPAEGRFPVLLGSISNFQHHCGLGMGGGAGWGPGAGIGARPEGVGAVRRRRWSAVNPVAWRGCLAPAIQVWRVRSCEITVQSAFG